MFNGQVPTGAPTVHTVIKEALVCARVMEEETVTLRHVKLAERIVCGGGLAKR